MKSDDLVLINQPSLIRALGFSKATFYRRRQADKKFPRPIKFDSARQGAVYYRMADVMAYIEQLGVQ